MFNKCAPQFHNTTEPTNINCRVEFFSQHSSRILNLNLSNGGERNSMKLAFKISAHNGDQLLLCWKLNTEIKRGKNVVFMAEITSRHSSGQYSTHGLGRLTVIPRVPSQDHKISNILLKYKARPTLRTRTGDLCGRRGCGVVRN